MAKGHKLRKDKKLCRGCHKRPALYIKHVRKRKSGITTLGKRQVAKTDKYHDLCGRCRRSLVDSVCAKPRLRRPNWN